MGRARSGASGDVAVVEDDDCFASAIYRVDPATRDRSIVREGQTGYGADLDGLRSMAATPDGDLVVTSLTRSPYSIEAVFRIDRHDDGYERISTENLREVTALPQLVPEPGSRLSQAVALLAAAAARRSALARRNRAARIC